MIISKEVIESIVVELDQNEILQVVSFIETNYDLDLECDGISCIEALQDIVLDTNSYILGETLNFMICEIEFAEGGEVDTFEFIELSEEEYSKELFYGEVDDDEDEESDDDEHDGSGEDEEEELDEDDFDEDEEESTGKFTGRVKIARDPSLG